MLCLRLFHQHVIPVLDNRGLLQRNAVLQKQAGIVKGDPEAPVALDQGGVNIAPVLLGKAPLLQGVPDREPGHLFRQQGFPAYFSGACAVGVGAQPPDLHQADAVRGGRPQLDKLAAYRLAERAVLVAFFRHDADNLPALFPQALGDALEHGGFARAAGAEGGEVAVGVLVVVKEVHKCRGAVVEIQPQEDAARIAQLVGRERKRPGNPLGQGVAAAFPLDVRVGHQQGQEG